MIYFWFIIGAVVGSFLNVCIYRLPRGESILFPPSHCPDCGTKLLPYDLVPIISYLFLLGRCRHCRKKISWRYPLVEALTAFAFVAAWQAVLGRPLDFIFYVIFLSVLIVIFFVDLEFKVIPDSVNVIGIISGLIFNLLQGTISLQIINFNPLTASVFGMLLGFLLLYAISFFGRSFYKKEVMGEGDLYLAALLGAYLGWAGVLLAIFLAYVIAALVAGAFLITGKVKLGSYIPFGPALAAGGIIALFYGTPLINWYLSNFFL
jgi:leader peptidase (prepilin peptidase) / N-methyltransferase